MYQCIFGNQIIHSVQWVAYKYMDAITDDLMVRTDIIQDNVRQIDNFVLQMVGSGSQEDFILRICKYYEYKL